MTGEQYASRTVQLTQAIDLFPTNPVESLKRLDTTRNILTVLFLSLSDLNDIIKQLRRLLSERLNLSCTNEIRRMVQVALLQWYQDIIVKKGISLFIFIDQPAIYN